MIITTDANVTLTNVKVDITISDAVKVINESLGYMESGEYRGYAVLEADDRRNPDKKKGIFRWDDISQHGSPCLEWEAVTFDPDATRKFEIAATIQKLLKEAAAL